MSTVINFIIKHYSLIVIGVFAILCIVLGKTCSENNELREEVSKKDSYIKDYESVKNGQMRELQMTITQLENSSDSINRKLDSVVTELGIAKKNLVSLQYISGVVHTESIDTVRFRDTVFVENLLMDTCIVQDDWLTYNLHLEYPSTMKLDFSIPLEFSIISSYKKEYVGKRSKIFFIRWFQKKRKYISVDVIEENPYVDLKETRFINVIK